MVAGAGLTAGSLPTQVEAAEEEEEAQKRVVSPYREGFVPVFPPPDAGKSPWGYDTIKEPAARPKSVRPGEENGCRLRRDRTPTSRVITPISISTKIPTQGGTGSQVIG
jgi:hypothetical protein